MKLVLLRHGESQWNLENRFTGWTDVPLSAKGEEEAKNAGVVMKNAGYDFDICYTSYLKRAIDTLNFALKSMDREWLPVIKSWKLNERHYGALQGLNKSETADKYGSAQVKIWRRSYDVRPPMLKEDDTRNPARCDEYRDVAPSDLPLGECLDDTVKRAVPYFNEEILPKMRAGKRVLIAAHGNSLRALVMYLEKLTPAQIMEVNIPTGVPLVYDLDDNLTVLKKEYLGDAEAIARKIKSVAAQGNAKK